MITRRIAVLAAATMLVAPSLDAQPTAQPTAQPAARTAARADTADKVVFTREVFSYPASGRRDPFASLIATGDIRPIFADLLVAGIVYDPTGRNSVAMLQDVSTGELYRARVGSVFGRLRITAIRAKDLSLAIDEFGFTRQEVLSLNIPRPGERTP